MFFTEALLRRDMARITVRWLWSWRKERGGRENERESSCHTCQLLNDGSKGTEASSRIRTSIGARYAMIVIIELYHLYVQRDTVIPEINAVFYKCEHCEARIVYKRYSFMDTITGIYQ